MKSIQVEIAAGERRCKVDAVALAAWGRALLDDILFEAARRVPERDEQASVSATLHFTVRVDESGALVVER